MSIKCDSCGEETSVYTVRFYNERLHQECKVCTQPRHSGYSSTVNPYSDLTLDHCLDDQNRPVRVTSRRQLEQAEKKYHFKSLVANQWEENFDKPPQQRKMNAMEELSHNSAVGKKDPKTGHTLGFLYPEIARAQLKELKEKNISIEDW